MTAKGDRVTIDEHTVSKLDLGALRIALNGIDEQIDESEIDSWDDLEESLDQPMTLIALDAAVRTIGTEIQRLIRLLHEVKVLHQGWKDVRQAEWLAGGQSLDPVFSDDYWTGQQLLDEAYETFKLEVREAEVVLAKAKVRQEAARTKPVIVRQRYGVHLRKCRDCGVDIWLARLSEEAKLKMRGQWVVLDAGMREGGMITLEDGLVYFDQVPGNCRKHQCPMRVIRCKYCGEPVRKMSQPEGEGLGFAVVNADTNTNGTVVLGRDGLIYHDPGHEREGPRFMWHTKH